MDDQGFEYKSASYYRDQRSARDSKGKRIWRIVFVIALLVFAASMVALGVIAYSYIQGQQKYGGVAETANVSDLDAALSGQVVATEIDNVVTVDWDALLAVNPDTVGWVYIPGTAINYPIVKGKDNEHYLTYDFDGSAGWLANYGAIFMDCKNNPDWSDQIYFIYGHHMNDGSMFADIANLKDQARFDASRTVYILSPRGHFRLRTFSLAHLSSDAEIVLATFGDSSQMREYIQDKIANSLVSVQDITDVSEMGKIFAFSTCDNSSGGRYILYAYVEDASDESLSGTIGIEMSDGNASGFVEELEVKE